LSDLQSGKSIETRVNMRKGGSGYKCAALEESGGSIARLAERGSCMQAGPIQPEKVSLRHESLQ